MGVRLPGRDHDRHVLRRLARPQAGELRGPAVQRRRRRGVVAGKSGQGRQRIRQALGPSRDARQHHRVVPGLVARETLRRDRPGPVHCEGDRDPEPGCDLFQVAAGRSVDRRRDVLPDGFSGPLRAGAPLRPHRLPGRGGEAVTSSLHPIAGRQPCPACQGRHGVAPASAIRYHRTERVDPTQRGRLECRRGIETNSHRDGHRLPEGIR